MRVAAPPRRRWLAALLLSPCVLAGCAMQVGADGRRQSVFDPRYLMKSDIDRVIDTVRSEVMDGLQRFADKLYRRNPREWKKGGSSSREDAVGRLFARTIADFPELHGRREGAAALYAFSEHYGGDRVRALMAGLLGMVRAAFEYKREFFFLDDLNAQKLYNCARNLEIAMWKLSTARNSLDEPLLLANDITPGQPNLSFEREFGRIVGLLDFLALVVADKHGRALTRFTQSMATAIFLPVGGL